MVRKVERKGFIQRFVSVLCFCALADEGNTGTTPEPTAPPINFEALIAQARQEEKAKLYPQIEKLKGERDNLTTSLNNTLLENAALKEENAKLKSQCGEKPEDSEAYKSLQAKFDELTAENETLKKSQVDEAEIRKQLEAEYEVKLYRNEQLEKNKGEILSMLTDDVKGATKEEIDAAIAAAKEKTLAVKKDLGLIDDKGNPINTPAPAPAPSEPPKRAPIAAPADGNAKETFTAEYIRNLDPRSPEYAEFRRKLGLK